MLNCLVVALGGGIGACLRYLIGLIPLKEPFIFPVKTLVINLLGCFVIGLAASLAVKNSSLSPKLVLFVKTGLCGGFTTFSTFALETETLIKTGQSGLAVLYIALSVVAGVGLAFAGQAIVGKQMNKSVLQNGDLLFMSDESDLSKAIIETTEKYSHVGIFFDSSKIL